MATSRANGRTEMAPVRNQTEIPGTEREHDQELSDLSEKVSKLTKERKKLEAKEQEERAKLLDMMKAKGVEMYIDEENELKATVKHAEDKVSVTKFKPKA